MRTRRKANGNTNKKQKEKDQKRKALLGLHLLAYGHLFNSFPPQLDSIKVPWQHFAFLVLFSYCFFFIEDDFTNPARWKLDKKSTFVLTRLGGYYQKICQKGIKCQVFFLSFFLQIVESEQVPIFSPYIHIFMYIYFLSFCKV